MQSIARGLAFAERLQDGAALGQWWTAVDDDRIECQLCPRNCRLRDGDRGFCFVRANRGGRMVLDTYGRSTGFCIDPIEKKPLNQFLPGTPILSFGTAGCNLGCKFCQNWDISKSREVARLSDQAEPEQIAQAALDYQCRSVAFTYNDPVIWAEYAMDVARACHAVGVKTVAVTAGYISPGAREPFFAEMDAANVDLKAFTEEFYYKITSSHLQPVLETLVYLKRETEVWFELTNLVIPNLNDSRDEFRQMNDWILEQLGDDVPIHYSAFHPDWKMRDRPNTPIETLIMAYDMARAAGLKYVYIGNVHDAGRQTTYCPNCQVPLIVRDWYQIHRYQLDGNRCTQCGTVVAGKYEAGCGTWGRKRQPIRLSPIPQRPLVQIASRSMSESPAQSKLAAQSKFAATADRPESTKQLGDLPPLSQTQLQELLRYATREVCRNVLGIMQLPELELSADLAARVVSGVFVTVKKQGTLRGCCGSLGANQPLREAIRLSAKRTALEDPRFPPISAPELAGCAIDISVLGIPQRLDCVPAERVNHVKVGVHGLRIIAPNQDPAQTRAGLLLPTVAPEQGWNSQQFLEGVCRKAGLPTSAWQTSGTVLELFTGEVCHGAIDDDQVAIETAQRMVATTPAPYSVMDVVNLTNHARDNVIAVLRGATPLYYALNLPDGTVNGLVMEISSASMKIGTALFQLSMRPGVPLQATLFQFCEQAAKWIEQQRIVDARLRLMLLHAPVLHGYGAAADLSRVEPSQRAIVFNDGEQTAIVYERDAASASELAKACFEREALSRETTQISSWHAITSEPSWYISRRPMAERGGEERPPAVAGTFYPARDDERDALVSSLIDSLAQDPAPVERKRVHAAMTPHAGLRYSGRLAADVWRRIELPKTVIVIGPKHTRQGVRWAVTPHRTWRISPTLTFENDLPLARRIAQSVPGMQLDASAHIAEHGIEVQLPILARVNPQVRVVGIAMGRASWEELEQAAKALAGLLKSLPEQPLLMVSSDMNHFADEAETRRRDPLAIAKLAAFDPRGLLDVCQAEEISMCGQVPAALVMLTLRELGIQPTYEEVGYDTSARVSGDTSRVVGYAGCLWV